GIGFVVTANDPYVGLDLDHCRDDHGAIAPWAQAIVNEFQSYTEITPSQHGLRIWVRGTWPENRGRRKNVGDGQIEVYGRERYFTVSGQHLPDTPFTIEDRTSELAAFHAREFGQTAPPSEPSDASAPIDDDDLLIRAMKDDRFARLFLKPFVASTAHPSHSEADLAFCIKLAEWTGKNPEQ